VSGDGSIRLSFSSGDCSTYQADLAKNEVKNMKSNYRVGDGLRIRRDLLGSVDLITRWSRL
jgi:hypothetical protein